MNIQIKSFRYAVQVVIGDEVLIPRNNELTSAKVMNVSQLVMQGTYISQISFCTKVHTMVLKTFEESCLFTQSVNPFVK